METMSTVAVTSTKSPGLMIMGLQRLSELSGIFLAHIAGGLRCHRLEIDLTRASSVLPSSANERRGPRSRVYAYKSVAILTRYRVRLPF